MSEMIRELESLVSKRDEEIEALCQRAEDMEVEFQRQREAYAQMVSGLGARNDVLLAMMKEMAEALDRATDVIKGEYPVEQWLDYGVDHNEAILAKYKGEAAVEIGKEMMK